ncbi:PREDICTED: probable oligoribonuclease isoform X3 [Polistes canadensis]|uniref:probable oligoribonuclease isoform X3 n=1 Tax=Polistes canadensis TaxID=91411 RepID=UPI000718F013|nr:PREDICTED: probable oligoribonuclease isoform X3 [Polistes canadensis]
MVNLIVYLYYNKLNKSNLYPLQRMMSTNNQNNHMVWIDMEMTGLDINTCHILEITCLITDSNLKIISDKLNIVINQPDSILSTMDNWCKEHHKKSKLIDDVRNSKISLKDAEQTVLKFLKSYVPRGKCPLAGNSVYMDRLFLIKYMPLVHDYLHYRIIDVSTIKEVARRWNSQIYYSAPPKTYQHRATFDILESIKELDHYKNCIFTPKNS